MSITGTGLAQAIKDEINLLTDEQKAEQSTVHGAVATAIVGYMTSNLVISGTYTGTVSGNPDPLNGPYVWSLSAVSLTGSDLVTGASSSFDDWVSEIEDGLHSMEILGDDDSGTITTTVAAFFTAVDLSGLTQDSLGDSDSFDDTWEIIGGEIVDAVLAVLPAPNPVSAVSSGGGSGSVTWNSVS